MLEQILIIFDCVVFLIGIIIGGYLLWDAHKINKQLEENIRTIEKLMILDYQEGFKNYCEIKGDMED
jgi:uncharacterized protein YneF (UPF0154 family)